MTPNVLPTKRRTTLLMFTANTTWSAVRNEISSKRIFSEIGNQGRLAGTINIFIDLSIRLLFGQWVYVLFIPYWFRLRPL